MNLLRQGLCASPIPTFFISTIVSGSKILIPLDARSSLTFPRVINPLSETASSSPYSHPKTNVTCTFSQISPQEIVLNSGKGIQVFCQCWTFLMSWSLVSKPSNDIHEYALNLALNWCILLICGFVLLLCSVVLIEVSIQMWRKKASLGREECGLALRS